MMSPEARSLSATRSGNARVVGLVPAAGQATRLSPIPCSKEIYPLGLGRDDARPKGVILYLLEKMRRAGIITVFIVIRDGKWDIPAYLGDGTAWGMHLAYLMMGRPFGTSYSLDQAHPFLGESLVAFGFPDILFGPGDVYEQLLVHQTTTKADVTLALFPAHNPAVIDMVEPDEAGNIRTLCIKPVATDFRYTWVCAVWSPTFTTYLHRALARRGDVPSGPEVTVGHILQGAIADGLVINSVPFDTGRYLDIGTPEHLSNAASFLERLVKDGQS